MDGVTFIRQIRSRKHTPVLMLTTESNREKKPQPKAGGHGLDRQTASPAKLLKAIAKVLP
jgi:CheY-like chemotaxis protein